MIKKNPLLDTEFLKKLYKNSQKELYAKVVALNSFEEPVEEITGKITSGSINVDGKSAVRRTCSLTMLAYDIKLTDYYWGIKTKFNLSVGLKNLIDPTYPEVIWFPQGVYVITSFNSSQTVNSFNISISGKDKMCLLNGDMSGSIHANSTQFDIVEDILEDGSSKKTKLPIKDIIRELVHGHAGELMHNIIINDLDDFGLELLEYRGSEPLYILFEQNTDNIENIKFINVNFPEHFVFKSLNTNNGLFIKESTPPSLFYEHNLAKIEYGQTAGYRLTELIYPQDLIANAGESVTSVLDKIKNILSDFEYFYDLNGRFIFQKKKEFINTSWNNLRTGSDGIVYAEAAAYQTPISWSFEGNELTTNISNTPSLNNLKNDFSVWGNRKSISGAEIPIHLRYAIDKKPLTYTTIAEVKLDEEDGVKIYRNANITYQSFNNTEDQTITTEWVETKNEIKDGKIVKRYLSPKNNSIVKCDYRELIYQMALDFRKANREDDFVPQLLANNPILCAKGRTGYEQYYIDMEGFWRQIYNPLKANSEEYDANGWHVNVKNDPSLLNFWIEFLDTDGDISKFSIPAIGDRAKVVNDKSIKSIYYKDTPLIIYYLAQSEIPGQNPTDTLNQPYIKPGYAYAQLSNIENLFSISSQGKTAKDELDSLLYTHAYCSESVSLNTIPIYSLQPNTRISIKDDENLDVNGEYTVSRITIPLTYNGMMSIQATKIPERIQ